MQIHRLTRSHQPERENVARQRTTRTPPRNTHHPRADARGPGALCNRAARRNDRPARIPSIRTPVHDSPPTPTHAAEAIADRSTRAQPSPAPALPLATGMATVAMEKQPQETVGPRSTIVAASVRERSRDPISVLVVTAAPPKGQLRRLCRPGSSFWGDEQCGGPRSWRLPSRGWRSHTWPTRACHLPASEPWERSRCGGAGGRRRPPVSS